LNRGNDQPPPQIHRVRGLNFDSLKEVDRRQIYQLARTCLKSKGVLDFQIRDSYINVYYAGGCIWKVEGLKQKGRGVKFSIDDKYFKRKSCSDLSGKFLPHRNADVNDWLSTQENLIKIMNDWFLDNPKKERKLQQDLSVLHLLNESSDWIIIDNEYAAWLHGKKEIKGDLNSRRVCNFDLISVKRKDLFSNSPLTIYLMELKQGQKSLGGLSGMKSHAEDMAQLLQNPSEKKAREALTKSIRNIIKEKELLTLLPKGAPSIFQRDIIIKPSFVLANASPAKTIIQEVESTLKEISSDSLWIDYSAINKNST